MDGLMAIVGGPRRGREKEKVARSNNSGERDRGEVCTSRSVFSQPGGAGRLTVGETVSRLRGTHGFGVQPSPTVECCRSCLFHVSKLRIIWCASRARGETTARISSTWPVRKYKRESIPLGERDGQQGFENGHTGDGQSLSEAAEHVDQPVSEKFHVQSRNRRVLRQNGQ